MGLLDVFKEEEKVEVKFSTLYSLLKEVSKSELLQNAVKKEVPHKYILDMLGHECNCDKMKEVNNNEQN